MAYAETAIDRPPSSQGPDVDEETGYLTHGELKRQFLDYRGAKSEEIKEAKQSDRYYHGAQWTDKEIKALKRRRQPVITSNRIVRKIDAVVGLVERLRQDPRAYPRTPQHEQGAEIATAVLRYALDHVQWTSKSPRAARHAAIKGIGGIELDLQFGDHGDPDIDMHLVYPDTYFYDPRSYDEGFSDTRYHGIAKYIDAEQAKELVPEKAEEIDDLDDKGSDMMIGSERDVAWFSVNAKKLLMVDHWYIHKGQWCWCLYCGTCKLMEGKSPYIDERGKSFSKFLMFSAAVDQDGDRYGFPRNFKGPQDEINHRRSKALHILNSRRVFAEKGAVDDVEKARTETARSDGWIEINPGKKVTPEDTKPDFAGQLQMLQEAKNEIENFGPNPALIGQGIEGSSGRAISLLQQAGIAELGPYMIAYRTWKLRVYRAIWNIVQRYWTEERWLRVTDDEGLAKFIQINGLTTDQYGQPAIANYLGSLDVDIILDEGPDNVNMMADSFDTLTALARGGAKIPPDVLIELAPLQNSVKKKLLEMLSTPDEAREMAKKVALAGEAAKVDETKSKTLKNVADAEKTGIDAKIEAARLGLDAFGLAHGAISSPDGLPAEQANPLAAPAGAPGPAPVSPPPGIPPGGSYGPVPGVAPPSADIPSLAQPPLPFPGTVPPGARQI